MLAVACIGLLAGCGGGGSEGQSSESSNISTKVPGQNNGFIVTENGRARHYIPYDSHKSKALHESVGYIANEYWIATTRKDDGISKQIIEGLGVKIIRYNKSVGFLVEAASQDQVKLIKSLKGSGGILGVYENTYVGNSISKEFAVRDTSELTYTPNDADTIDLNSTPLGGNWHIEYLKLPKLWYATTGSSSLSIGVVDSGIRKNTSEVSGRIIKNYFPKENSSHGTAVTGIIGASTDNIYGISGINWNSPILFTSSAGNGEPTSVAEADVLVARMQELIDENPSVKLINASWGPFACTNMEEEVVDKDCENKSIEELTGTAIKLTRPYRLLAESNPDVLFIWSGGNDGWDASAQNGAIQLDEDGRLVKLPNVITVAAMQKNEMLYPYSVFGKTIDIAAPSGVMAPAGDGVFYDALSAADYGLYDAKKSFGFDGTSAAAPVVTGVASLLWSTDTELKAWEIKTAILEGASGKSVTTRFEFAKDTKPKGDTRAVPLVHPIPILNAENAMDRILPKPTVKVELGQTSTIDGFPVMLVPTAISRNGAILEYKWDFGDSTSATVNSGASQSHLFPGVGSYNVKLTVTDYLGKSASAVLTVVVAPAGPIANGWCNQEVNFDGGIVHPAWTPALIRSGPGLRNNRIEGSPTDSGARIDGSAITMTSGVNKLVFEYNAVHSSSLWGMHSGIDLIHSDGDRWTFDAVNASANFGGNTLAFVIDRGNGKFGTASINNRLRVDTVPFVFGEYRFKLELTNTTAKWTATNVATGQLLQPPAQAIPAGFNIANLRHSNFFVYTTTGNPIWADNLKTQCLQ